MPLNAVFTVGAGGVITVFEFERARRFRHYLGPAKTRIRG